MDTPPPPPPPQRGAKPPNINLNNNPIYGDFMVTGGKVWVQELMVVKGGM